MKTPCPTLKFFHRSRFLIATTVVLVAAENALVMPASAATVTFVDLNPAGSTNSAAAAGSGLQQAGYVTIGGVIQAALEATGVLPAGWSTVTTPWTTNAGQVFASLSNTALAQLFRLRSPPQAV